MRFAPLSRGPLADLKIMLARTHYLKLCVLLPFICAPLWAALALSSAVLPIPGWLGFAITVGWMGPLLFGALQAFEWIEDGITG